MDSTRFNELRDNPKRTPEEEIEYNKLKSEQGTKGGQSSKEQEPQE